MNPAPTLPERVARVIAVLGLFVAIYQLADSSVLYYRFGFYPPVIWAPPWLQIPLQYVGVVLLLLAPVLLLTGSIADLRAHAWGRRLMILYAWLWLAVCVLYVVERSHEFLWGALAARLSSSQKVQFVLDGLGTSIYGSILPLVILAFRNVGRIAPSVLTHRGFEPIVQSQSRGENQVSDHRR